MRLSIGGNISIHAKEIIGIVFPLDLLEPCIGFNTKGIANKMLSLAMAGKVQIQPPGPMALHVLPKRSHPGDISRIILWLCPDGIETEHEGHGPIAEGCRISSHPLHCATE